MRKFLIGCLLLISTFSFAQSTTVVISQVYGGGGGSTGTYLFDYVELHNVSASAQSLSGMSLQYGSSTGNFGSSATNIYAFPGTTSIPAGGYLLVQLSSTGTAGSALPVTPDLVTTNLSMSGSSGKVALANQTAALACGATATPCSLPATTIIDLVAYGASNNGEGNTTVNNGTALTTTQGSVRKNNGCTETNNNNADFDVVTAPVPRNAASAIFSCVAATPTLTATTLTAFGDQCINTTTGPNSFTLTGANLSNGNISIAALTGFTYAATATGTYTSTLTIPNSGGALSQDVFVKFTPTAVQSYNGNISISGGGLATPLLVAASGAGINTLPAVSTGTASGITQVAATLAGSVLSNGCATVTAYGIEYSTTNGFANGAGTQVSSSNISSGAYTASLTALNSGTTYYYKSYATSAAGTAYGTQQSFTTSSPNPVLSATALTAFGNACISSTAGPNSFTITGTNLTTANVDIAALTGYTYSSTSGGTYTSTLSIPQSGGSFSQQVFVKFNPAAVQAYAGNIVVSGGGAAASVTVAASGTGVNTMPTVSTGASSGVTGTLGTLAGSISANGCSGVTAYGIEYSTTNGFSNGAGTRVASSNLSSGTFSAALSGLTASTTYYYKAYATNSGGTAYGAQQSFTTTAPPAPVMSVTALAPFGNACVGSFAGPASFTITGNNLTNALITVGPLSGYTFSQTSTGTFSDVIGILQAGGTQSFTVYVRFVPTAVQTYAGNIPVYGGGASTAGVAASGSGVNNPASVTTGSASAITTTQAAIAGSYANDGCTTVTGYGIEYSSVNGFTNGTGTRLPASGAVSGSFQVTISGLVQGATYYYKAYATTAGAINYGVQRSFTAASIASGFHVFPSPAQRGTTVRVTKAGLAPGNYTMLLLNLSGQSVWQQQFQVQGNYINQTILLPATMPFGIYKVVLANYAQKLDVIDLVIQ